MKSYFCFNIHLHQGQEGGARKGRQDDGKERIHSREFLTSSDPAVTYTTKKASSCLLSRRSRLPALYEKLTCPTWREEQIRARPAANAQCSQPPFSTKEGNEMLPIPRRAHDSKGPLTALDTLRLSILELARDQMECPLLRTRKQYRSKTQGPGVHSRQSTASRHSQHQCQQPGAHSQYSTAKRCSRSRSRSQHHTASQQPGVSQSEVTIKSLPTGWYQQPTSKAHSQLPQP